MDANPALRYNYVRTIFPKLHRIISSKFIHQPNCVGEWLIPGYKFQTLVQPMTHILPKMAFR
jgi:hypothetical protein